MVKSNKSLVIFSVFFGLCANASEVILGYDYESKSYVIDVGYLKEDDFTGNDVIIDTPETDKEITLLTNEDSAPGIVCYKGDVEDAKKIVESMIVNIDGNGDYFLESYSVNTGDDEKIDYWFMRVGEDGEQTEESTIPKCN